MPFEGKATRPKSEALLIPTLDEEPHGTFKTRRKAVLLGMETMEPNIRAVLLPPFSYLSLGERLP
jgi:hypothetical protein